MKKRILTLLLTCAVTLTGCTNSTVTEKDVVSSDIALSEIETTNETVVIIDTTTETEEINVETVIEDTVISETETVIEENIVAESEVIILETEITIDEIESVTDETVVAETSFSQNTETSETTETNTLAKKLTFEEVVTVSSQYEQTLAYPTTPFGFGELNPNCKTIGQVVDMSLYEVDNFNVVNTNFSHQCLKPIGSYDYDYYTVFVRQDPSNGYANDYVSLNCLKRIDENHSLLEVYSTYLEDFYKYPFQDYVNSKTVGVWNDELYADIYWLYREEEDWRYQVEGIFWHGGFTYSVMMSSYTSYEEAETRLIEYLEAIR